MTRWGDLLERKPPTPTPRFYVARATGPGLGIGTIETTRPMGTRPVMSGDVISWTYGHEPVLLDGATVELLGPMTEGEAASAAAGVAAEGRMRTAAVRQQAADDARVRARLILGPQRFYVPPDDPQYDDRVEALAQVIFWAYGYDGQELPK